MSPAGPGTMTEAGGRRLMVGIVATILLIAFEAMAVATAMPRAVGELHGLAFYAWAFTGYVVASLFAMVVAGEWWGIVGFDDWVQGRPTPFLPGPPAHALKLTP